MRPGFKSRKRHLFILFFFFFCFFFFVFFVFFFFFDFFNLFIFCVFFFFFCHYYYSANLQIQHYCLYSVFPTLLLLMMPRPPAPSAL